jgi:hypothetical protein
MRLPIRRILRPRITIGQILATVAIASLPIAVVMRTLHPSSSIADALVAFFLGSVSVVLLQVFFWAILVPGIPPIDRLLGRPSWTWVILDVNPEGVSWLDDKPDRRGIQWVEPEGKERSLRACEDGLTRSGIRVKVAVEVEPHHARVAIDSGHKGQERHPSDERVLPEPPLRPN